jgi:hypothetical protein
VSLILTTVTDSTGLRAVGGADRELGLVDINAIALKVAINGSSSPGGCYACSVSTRERSAKRTMPSGDVLPAVTLRIGDLRR